MSFSIAIMEVYSVNQLFEDREGNLWVATSKGIDMFRDLRVITISKSEGLSEDNAESVLAARDGTVWIGSEHLQALDRDGVFCELGKGLPGNQVTSLLEDHAVVYGSEWVTPYGSAKEGRKTERSVRSGNRMAVRSGWSWG